MNHLNLQATTCSCPHLACSTFKQSNMRSEQSHLLTKILAEKRKNQCTGVVVRSYFVVMLQAKIID